MASVRIHTNAGFREVGRRERISQLHGMWRDTLLLKRRSTVVGVLAPPATLSLQSRPLTTHVNA